MILPSYQRKESESSEKILMDKSTLIIVINGIMSLAFGLFVGFVNKFWLSKL